MLRTFLLTIVVAAMFSGLAYPLYARLLSVVRGHRPLASALTVLLVVGLVLGPLFGVASLLVNQAVRATESIRPVVERFSTSRRSSTSNFSVSPGLKGWADIGSRSSRAPEP